jgi:hypothetical protein
VPIGLANLLHGGELCLPLKSARAHAVSSGARLWIAIGGVEAVPLLPPFYNEAILSHKASSRATHLLPKFNRPLSFGGHIIEKAIDRGAGLLLRSGHMTVLTNVVLVSVAVVID